MARWAWELKTVGFSRQTDLTTENTNITLVSGGGEMVAFTPEVDVPDFVRSLETFAAATGQAGAKETPAVGSKDGGTFKIRHPMQAYKSGYVRSTDVPGTTQGVVSPIAVLLANALGSNNGSPTAAQFAAGSHLSHIAWSAGGVGAGSSTTILKLTDATGATIGAFVVTSTADDGVPAVAWIKNAVTAGGPPDDATYYDAVAAADVAAAADDLHPTSTAWLSGLTQIPMTVSIFGDNASFRIALIGCVANKITIGAKPGMTPMVEIEYTYTDRKWYASGGALFATATFQRAQPLLGQNGARLNYGASGGSGALTCGVSDFVVSVEYTLARVPCHGKAQGVSEVVVTERKVRAEFSIPHDSGDTITSGEHLYEEDLRNGTAKSIAVYVGLTSGKMFSILLPSVHHAEQPKLENKDGLLSHKIVMEAGTYYADGTAGAIGTAPADTVLRVGIA